MLTDGYKSQITAMAPLDARRLVLRALQSYVLYERGDLRLPKTS